MRLIDADALIDLLCKVPHYTDLSNIFTEIESMPTIDIVQCKDCIDNDHNLSGAENWCLKFGYDCNNDDYCGYGERKEQ